MEKWICDMCGYTHNGKEAPEVCPQCGAPKSQFYCEGKNNRYAYGVLFILIIILAFAAMAFISCNSSVSVDNSTVKTVDVNKYLGRWYEIARFDHRFERDMEKCTATYSMQDNGKIKVTNKGIKNGKWKTSIGKAKLTDTPGVLRVSFFGPFYSDYRIMMLASDYSYALIGSNSDDYLWILSRTPTLKRHISEQIIQEAHRRGYETDNLIWVNQDPL